MKTRIELSEQELQTLAEMAGFCLVALSMVKNEVDDVHVNAWQLMCQLIFEKADKVPWLAKRMEKFPGLEHPFFTEEYTDSAFFAVVLDQLREILFWDELVARMADQTLLRALGEKKYNKLTDEARQRRAASLEKVLWDEVINHGLEHLSFILPPEEEP